MKALDYKTLQKEVLDLYRTGGGNTFYLGFKALEAHYNIKAGSCTDWTGYPGSGKSELLFEILMNTNEYYGHKHLLYMPDAGTNAEVAAKLLHKLTGKQFNEHYYSNEGQKVKITNRLSELDIMNYLGRIHETFVFLDIEQSDRKSKSITPVEFWEYAVKNKKELGIFSAVIDSWNYMRHDTEGKREDKWLEEVLSYRNILAEDSGLHFHTIIHPKSAVKTRDGEVVPPTYHDLKGGSEWSNNGKSIVIVHRDAGSNVAQINIAKAKPAIVGIQGEATLSYDLSKGRYYENVGGADNTGVKKYAEKKPIDEYMISDSIKPNLDF
tara:strand:+ start:4114 stop:5085 length:972 start_codon:yes stop_codon:yes gene_type:complete